MPTPPSLAVRPSAPLAVTWVNVSATTCSSVATAGKNIHGFLLTLVRAREYFVFNELVLNCGRYFLSEGMLRVFIGDFSWPGAAATHLWLVETVAVMRSSLGNEERIKQDGRAAETSRRIGPTTRWKKYELKNQKKKKIKKPNRLLTSSVNSTGYALNEGWQSSSQLFGCV